MGFLRPMGTEGSSEPFFPEGLSAVEGQQATGSHGRRASCY